ncbi:hypothetical protein [Micrococcus endophyticus]|uniref:hypothetical protein n=1 Tax=Micrococcus endophyticus TaxID=455343 RepID=UPI002004ED46|nr:hypothetical protein [Micrococcus endophyticus]MCK6091599.1 hypothetical protein [Micrococcus endophyticus]
MITALTLALGSVLTAAPAAPAFLGALAVAALGSADLLNVVTAGLVLFAVLGTRLMALRRGWRVASSVRRTGRLPGHGSDPDA